MKNLIGLFILLSLSACASTNTQTQPLNNNASKHELPPHNPYFADSTAATMHGGATFGRLSKVAASIQKPNAGNRQLHPDELIWRAAELATWGNSYSGVYPNGRRVLWTGGGRVLFKFDADTLEPLASLQVRDGTPMNPQEVDAYITKLDSLEGDDYYKTAVQTLMPEMAGAAAAYRIVTNENEVFMLAFDPIRKQSILKVYGDAVTNDPDSAIELKREWVLPKVSNVAPFGFALNITFDGRVLVGTRDGTLFSVSRDLKDYSYLVLPRPESLTVDTDSSTFRASDSFVRNTFPVDPDGGIYIVSHTQMFRVQWTGEKLSLDEKDGAWSAPYNGADIGSGTSPALMGWGDKEDQLVIIGDGRPDGKMHLLAYWRNDIPNDWQGIEGYDHRVAGIVPVDYGKHTPKYGTIENSLPIKGYGILVANDHPPLQPEYDGGIEEKLFVHYYAVSQSPDYVPHGVRKFEWNPITRKLESAWQSDMSFTTTIPVVDINNMVYAVGSRAGKFTLEAVDWLTGEEKFHYILGKSIRYHPNGASLMIAPNGALDCYCQGGAGIVRIQPK